MSFYYAIFGDNMKVYLDILFFLNFAFDFLLLTSVSLLLRRNAKLKRLLLASLIGGLSIFLLFLPLNSFSLFLWKIGISTLMTLIAFGYKDFSYTFKNILYLYMTSIVLGGVLYFLNVTFSYKQEGLVFYHNGLSINFIVLLLLSPIILKMYVKELRHLKNHYSHYYEVTLYLEGKKYIMTAFLDTGNHLKDPYTKKPILLVYNKKLLENIRAPILVPYETASGSSMLSCIKGEKIVIKGIGERKNCLIGLLQQKIGIDGVDCILQEQILEGDYA